MMSLARRLEAPGPPQTAAVPRGRGVTVSAPLIVVVAASACILGGSLLLLRHRRQSCSRRASVVAPALVPAVVPGGADAAWLSELLALRRPLVGADAEAAMDAKAAVAQQDREQFEAPLRAGLDLLQRVHTSWNMECRDRPDYHPALERQALTELYVRSDRPEVESDSPRPMDPEEAKLLLSGLPMPDAVEAVQQLTDQMNRTQSFDPALTAARQKVLADALHLVAEVCVQASRRWSINTAEHLQSDDPELVQHVQNATMLMAYMGRIRSFESTQLYELAAQRREDPDSPAEYVLWHLPLAGARVEHHLQRGEWKEAETRLVEFEEVMTKTHVHRGSSPTEAAAQTRAFANFDRARIAQLQGEYAKAAEYYRATSTEFQSKVDAIATQLAWCLIAAGDIAGATAAIGAARATLLTEELSPNLHANPDARVRTSLKDREQDVGVLEKEFAALKASKRWWHFW